MASPEQTLFLSDRYRTVNLSGKDGTTHLPRNVTKDLLDIFDDAQVPMLATVRNELRVHGSATASHPAYDMTVRKSSESWGGRKVTIADTMRRPGAAAVWATLCLYQEMDGYREMGDRLTGLSVVDDHILAGEKSPYFPRQDANIRAAAEALRPMAESLEGGAGYFDQMIPPVTLPHALQRLEEDRSRWLYPNGDPEPNAVMNMIGSCVSSEAFSDAWNLARREVRAADAAHHLWSSGVFAPQTIPPVQPVA